jgi:hypothetical protein
MTSGALANVARLRQLLRRFRRRLASVAFVRLVPAVTLLAVLATETAVVGAHLTGRHAAIVFVVAVALALALAGWLAAWRTRSLPGTAATLDRLFHLDDALLTAVAFADHPDPVSNLVVADAVGRLNALAPRDLPLEPPPGLRWMAALGAIALVVGLMLGRQALLRESSGGAPGQSAREAEGTSVPSRAPATAAAVVGATPRERQDHAGAVQHDPAAGTRPDALPRDVRDRPERQPSEERSNPADGRSGNGAKAGAGADARHADSRTDAPPASRSRGGAGDAQRSAASAAHNDRGGGRGSGIATRAGTGAGGANGALRAPAPADSNTMHIPVDDARYAARFRAAWSRAEAPLAQERLPAERRAYVRDYFLAIRPSGTP